jgi:hypothetical protein
MLTYFRIALGIALVALPGPVSGNRYCDPTDPENGVQTATEGHVAPFSGVILTHQRAEWLTVPWYGESIFILVVTSLFYFGVQKLIEVTTSR